MEVNNVSFLRKQRSRLLCACYGGIPVWEAGPR